MFIHVFNFNNSRDSDASTTQRIASETPHIWNVCIKFFNAIDMRCNVEVISPIHFAVHVHGNRAANRTAAQRRINDEIEDRKKKK